MSDTIFGYSWDEIQAAQAGTGRLGRAIDTSAPVAPLTLNDADRKLIAQHGTVEALEAVGYYGLADRIKRGAH